MVPCSLGPAAAALSALILTTQFAFADMVKVGELHIFDQWARESPKMAKAGAGYLTIKNTGTEDDALVAVTADFPKVMVHGTKKENGVMKMHHVDALTVSAGDAVALEPGGFHIMFMGLDENGLRVGDAIDVTLTFKKAGDVTVKFPVRPIE